MRLFLIITITMIAFAANSVLARLALGPGEIDAAAYSLVRLLSGAIMLSILAIPGRELRLSQLLQQGSWISALALFGYAAAFSFAYLLLETGTGALILFPSVQAAMVAWALYRGDRPGPLEWLGLVTATGAIVWLLSPGLTAPDPLGALLMIVAGVSWAIYTLRGTGSADPLKSTTGNFIRSVPIALVLMLFYIGSAHATPFGIAMATISGAVTSAMGYALWYYVLKQITATQAAVTQLSAPVIAAIMGLALTGDTLTLRFVAASAFILGGVAIAILGRSRRT